MAYTGSRDAVNLEAIQTTFYWWIFFMPKILIIDDDVTITDLLKTLMKMQGHTPTTLNDSTKALEIAGTLDPDLITLDLMMPGLTGFELCELLHQDPKFARIPIVIVSARDDPESKERAMKAGAREYVTKPFGADELMKKIQELTSS
jgi:two-component system, sensor histidine kinase and response regulator